MVADSYEDVADDRWPVCAYVTLLTTSPIHLDYFVRTLFQKRSTPSHAVFQPQAPVPLTTGLVPWGDFVLAWSGGPLHSENDFYKLIEAHVDKPLRLFVYNSDLE